jgi:hypothetical protein
MGIFVIPDLLLKVSREQGIYPPTMAGADVKHVICCHVQLVQEFNVEDKAIQIHGLVSGSCLTRVQRGTGVVHTEGFEIGRSQVSLL